MPEEWRIRQPDGQIHIVRVDEADVVDEQYLLNILRKLATLSSAVGGDWRWIQVQVMKSDA